MLFEHKNKGVCSSAVRFEIEDNIVKNVKVIGGCNGNSQGVAALAEGMDADDLIRRLKGIRCGFKDTSCPDQLARAVEEAKAKIANG